MTKRKAKQKTWKSTLVTLAMFLGGGAVGYLGAGLIKGESIKEMLPESGSSLAIAVATALILVFIAYLVCILIHELGHVVGGLLMGNTFSFMTVGPFQWIKEDGRLQFQWNSDMSTFGGLALTLPNKVEGFKKRRLIVIGGGPLASLLLFAVAWWISLSVPEGYRLGNLFFKILSFFSLLIFVVTIIPAKVGGFMTDGMQLLRTLKNDASAKKYADFMQLFALNQQGVRPNQFPATLIEEHTTEELKDSLDLGFTHFQFQTHLSNNDIPKAEQLLDRIYNHLDIYPKTFQVDVLAEMLFFNTIINPNKEKSDLLLEEIGEDIPKTSVFMKNLLAGTKAILSGDKKLAKVEFEKVLQSSKKDGTSLMYKDWIDKMG